MAWSIRSRSASHAVSAGPRNRSDTASHRRHRCGDAAISRALGRPATVTVISSPASTRRTSSEASWRSSRSPTVLITQSQHKCYPSISRAFESELGPMTSWSRPSDPATVGDDLLARGRMSKKGRADRHQTRSYSTRVVMSFRCASIGTAPSAKVFGSVARHCVPGVGSLHPRRNGPRRLNPSNAGFWADGRDLGIVRPRQRRRVSYPAA